MARLDEGREGLHNLGFWPDDMERSCAAPQATGFEEAYAVFMPDASKNVSYFSSPNRRHPR